MKRPPPGTAYVPVPDDGARRVRIKLGQLVNLDQGFRAGESFQKILEFLADRYDVEIRIDEPAFNRIGKEHVKEAKTRLPPLHHNVNLGNVFRLLSDQVDGTIEIRKGTVWIVPQPGPSNLAEHLGWPSKALRRLLNDPVTLDKSISDATLSQVLDDFGERFDTSFIIDNKAFTRAGRLGIGAQAVKVVAQKNVSPAQLLKTLLDPLDATYVMRSDLVLIIPKSKDQKDPERR